MPDLPVPRDDAERERYRLIWAHGWGAGAAATLRRNGRPSTQPLPAQGDLVPTTREVSAAKAQRLRQARRAITPDMLGPRCAVCHQPMVRAVADYDGCTTHPACDPRQTKET